jgi:phosphatidylinositol kinase/protein kinase (PI-3  family)
MLLKREGVDLRIVTYKVTPTSHNSGFVQVAPCKGTAS